MFLRFCLFLAWIVLLSTSVFAENSLYYMERVTGKSIPIPSASDIKMSETSSKGVYRDIINITKGMTFGFYTGEAGEPDVIYQSVNHTNLSFFGMENPVWPEGGNRNGAAMREKGANEIGTWWCILSFTDPQEKVVPVLVTVDLNSKQITLAQQEINEELPECLYIWGSPDGKERFQCVARLEPTVSNPTVFEAKYNVPEVLEFFDDTDDGGGGSVGDEGAPVLPDHGFRFNISTDGTSVTGGKKFFASIENAVIDFSEDVSPFTSDLLPLQSCVFFDLTPGETLFTVDYSAKKITVKPTEAAQPDPGVEDPGVSEDVFEIYVMD